MTPTPEALAQLIEELRRRAGQYDPEDWHGDIEIKAATALESLRSRLAEVERERDEAHKQKCRGDDHILRLTQRATAAESENEALRRKLSAKWLPIETGPHSGIGVLLLQPWRSGHDTVLIGHYANGWVNRDCEELQPRPTHWMPLPQPIQGHPYTTHKPGMS